MRPSLRRLRELVSPLPPGPQVAAFFLAQGGALPATAERLRQIGFRDDEARALAARDDEDYLEGLRLGQTHSHRPVGVTVHSPGPDGTALVLHYVVGSDAPLRPSDPLPDGVRVTRRRRDHALHRLAFPEPTTALTPHSLHLPAALEPLLAPRPRSPRDEPDAVAAWRLRALQRFVVSIPPVWWTGARAEVLLALPPEQFAALPPHVHAELLAAPTSGLRLRAARRLHQRSARSR